MFEFNGKQYELKFNMERQKYVENTTKTSLMGEFASNQGMFSILTMETVFRFCLHECGSDVFVGQKEAVQICDDLIKEKGYGSVVLMIQNAMKDSM